MSDSEHAGEKKEEQPSPASSPLVSQTTNVFVNAQTPPGTSDRDPCPVCGDLIRTDGNHYGVRSCDACGQFFGKVVRRQKEIGECRKSGNCEITKYTKNACEKCRYKKCLAAGMKQKGKGKQSGAGATPKGETRPEQDLNTSNGSEVETPKKDVAGVRDENTELEKTVCELAGRLAALESKGSEVETLKKDVADLQDETAGLKDRNAELARRLAALESKVDTPSAGGDNSVHPSDKS